MDKCCSPIAETKWSGFKLVGDNLDKHIKPCEMCEDHQNRLLNCFQLYAVRDRIDLSSFSDKEPKFNIKVLKSVTLLPSRVDTKQLMDNLAILVVRILCKHILFFMQLDKVFCHTFRTSITNQCLKYLKWYVMNNFINNWF